MADAEAYAKALAGHIGQPAALVDGCAGRPIANPANHGSDNKGLSSSLDEKRGARQGSSCREVALG